MEDLTIGMLKTRNRKNGSPITDINSKDDLEKVRASAVGKKKEDLPVLTAYRGVRGEYKPSNIFFVDIDTKEGVDKIIANPEKLFDNFRNIYFIQKSYSGKLHICGIFAEEIETAEEWSYMTRIYTAATLYAIKKLYGIDYAKIEKGIDDHSFKYSQLLYVSAENIFFNSNLTRITFGDKDISMLFEEYPTLKPTEKEIKVYQAGDLQSKYECGDSTNRICIDRNFKIGELSGNDIRWRISKIATELFGNDAKKWCDERFYYGKGTSIFSNTRKDIGINHLVLNWLVANNYITIKEKPWGPQTNPNYACIDMDAEMGMPETLFDTRSSKFLSSYVKEIDSYIQNENILSIIAPTGSGKTSCLSGIVNRKRTGEGLVDLYPNSYIIVPMNVTNELYKGLNIVSSNSNNKIIYGKPNVMIWDQFNKNFDAIKKHRPDIVFIDESHTLYLDRSYRDSAIKCIEKLRLLQDLGTKIVFISATPAGEVNMFNAFVLEFKRKDTRHVKFQLCYTEDTLNAIMDDVRTEGFNKICIFSDRDSRLAYAYCIKDNKDAMIYHSEWKSNVDQLRKDEKVMSSVSFFTCLAFNGLNIRNTGEKILIDIRLTPGVTTYNEIIQIVGRFRFNDDITVRLYVDNKYSNNVDLQEAFNDAKAIIDSDSEEVITPYWERMNDKDVQDALTSIKEYCDKFSLSYIVSLIKNDGYPIKAYKVSGAEKLKKRNPLKEQASNLYKALRMNKIDMIDRENTDKEVLKFIDQWEHEINAMRYSYNDKVLEVLDSMISKDSKKTSVVMGTLIDRMKNILKIWNMTDQEWIEMISKRAVLLATPGLSQKTKDNLRKVFKANDEIRIKYKDMDFNNIAANIIDEQDAFFDSYIESRSDGGKKGDKVKKSEAGKKGKRIIYNGVEYSTCKECAAAIGKSVDTVTRWIKNGKIITV